MLQNLFVRLLIATLVVLLMAVLALWLGEGMPPEEALFSSVALLAQGEPMTVQPAELEWYDKIIITLVMISGAALMAMIFALVTDKVLSLRLDYLLGKRGVPVMNDHIILIGLGTVGYRTWQALKKFPDNVGLICIEKNPDNPNLETVRRAGDTVIVEDPRNEGVLDKASVKTARTVICATNDDLANLDFALTAREMKPGVRIVLRMYDQRLARKVQDGFDIQVAFSSSALAAPAFAAAAYDRNIINSYYLGSYQVVTARVNVNDGSTIAGMKTRAIERDYHCALLKHISSAGESVLYPQDDSPVAPGHVLLVSTTYEQFKELKKAAGDTSS